MDFGTAEITEISCEMDAPILCDNRTLNNDPQMRHKRKKKHINRLDWKSSVLKEEKKRANCLMQRILSAKHRTMCDQQCIIDDMRRKMSVMAEDNRYLREQCHVQATIIDKLDGKNAKMPSLLNSQVEEIRVYREQLRRLKEIFLRTNKARQEAEASRQKAEEELQHLRNLAFSKNLPEREQLIEAVSSLQEKVEGQEKSNENLQRYIGNLEKNQRCERNRLMRAQKELQFTCNNLSESVRELQISLLEKQKIIDGKCSYNQRTIKSTSRTLASEYSSELQRGSEFMNNKHQNAEIENIPITQISEPVKPHSVDVKKIEKKETPAQILADIQNEIKAMKNKEKPNIPRKSREMDIYPKDSSVPECRPKTSSLVLAKGKNRNDTRVRPRSTAGDVVIPTKSIHLDQKPKAIQFTNTEGKLVNFYHQPDNTQDETFELLRANEKLARLVAEARMQCEEAKVTQPMLQVSTTNRYEKNTRSIVSANSLPKSYPTQISTSATKNEDIRYNIEENEKNEETGKKMEEYMSPVSASGDLPEILELDKNSSWYEEDEYSYSATPKTPGLITKLVKQICDKEISKKVNIEQDSNISLDALPSPTHSTDPELAKSNSECFSTTQQSIIERNWKKSSNRKNIDFKEFGTNRRSSKERDSLPRSKNAQFSSHRETDLRKTFNRIPSIPSRTVVKNSKAVTEQYGAPSQTPGLGTRLASTLFNTQKTGPTSRTICEFGCKEGLLPCIHRRHDGEN